MADAREDIRKAGKVRHIGVSDFTVADLEAASAVAPVTSLQPPYSALRRDIEQDVLPMVPGARRGRHRLLADAVGAADRRA